MYNKEFTPERISELKPNEVFVFGSNLAGSHGGGAARLAYDRFDAIWGQGVGLQGQSYGIPTMQGEVETIRPYMDEFIEFVFIHYLHFLLHFWEFLETSLSAFLTATTATNCNKVPQTEKVTYINNFLPDAQKLCRIFASSKPKTTTENNAKT